MANNFTDAISAWLFPAGALTTDSKGLNTLTAVGSISSGTAIQGAAAFAAGANKYFTIPDANLSAGFPLKTGDVTKKITVCYKWRPNSGGESPIVGKLSFGSAGCFGLTFNPSYFFQYEGTYNNSGWGLPAITAGHEYQFIYAIDWLPCYFTRNGAYCSP